MLTAKELVRSYLSENTTVINDVIEHIAKQQGKIALMCINSELRAAEYSGLKNKNYNSIAKDLANQLIEQNPTFGLENINLGRIFGSIVKFNEIGIYYDTDTYIIKF